MRAGSHTILPGCAFGMMTQEHLPLCAETIAVEFGVWHVLPAAVEINGIWLVWIPHRLRCIDPMLRYTRGKACHCLAQWAVHLKGHEIITPYPRTPGGVDLYYHAIVEFKRCVGGIIGVSHTGLSCLVPAFRNVSGTETGGRSEIAEEVVDDIAPVTQHVQDDATAISFPVIP